MGKNGTMSAHVEFELREELADVLARVWGLEVDNAHLKHQVEDLEGLLAMAEVERDRLATRLKRLKGYTRDWYRQALDADATEANDIPIVGVSRKLCGRIKLSGVVQSTDDGDNSIKWNDGQPPFQG